MAGDRFPYDVADLRPLQFGTSMHYPYCRAGSCTGCLPPPLLPLPTVADQTWPEAMTSTRRSFINELGNPIVIEVELVGTQGLRYTMTGPTSTTTNEITKAEADELVAAIRRVHPGED